MWMERVYSQKEKLKIPDFASDFIYIQGVPGGKVNILGDNSIGHYKKKVCKHVSYSEQFPR
jgi:hypothetical protein